MAKRTEKTTDKGTGTQPATRKKSTTKKAAAKKAPPKKAAPKKKTVAKKKAVVKKKSAVKKATVKKKTVAKKKAVTTGSIRQITPDERRRMIAEAAYLRGASQGFLSHEMDDWLTAEAEVDALLLKSNTLVMD